MGLADRVNLLNVDAFDYGIEDSTYDLVFWKSALHHMLDIREAVEFFQAYLTEGRCVFGLRILRPE